MKRKDLEKLSKNELLTLFESIDLEASKDWICDTKQRIIRGIEIASSEDLVKSKYIKGKNYEIIHYESPDKRGIDVALLYQKKYFTPIFHQSFNPNIYRNNRKVYTRDQLLVTGYLDDELIHIIVNHWPSRSGGEIKSRPLREKAAYQNTKIIEQVRAMDLNAKIIIMGDFNDDPINTSFKNVLKTKSDKKKVAKNDTPKHTQIVSFWEPPSAQNALFSYCFRTKTAPTGPPKGIPKWLPKCIQKSNCRI